MSPCIREEQTVVIPVHPAHLHPGRQRDGVILPRHRQAHPVTGGLEGQRLLAPPTSLRPLRSYDGAVGELRCIGLLISQGSIPRIERLKGVAHEQAGIIEKLLQPHPPFQRPAFVRILGLRMQ